MSERKYGLNNRINRRVLQAAALAGSMLIPSNLADGKGSDVDAVLSYEPSERVENVMVQEQPDPGARKTNSLAEPSGVLALDDKGLMVDVPYPSRLEPRVYAELQETLFQLQERGVEVPEEVYAIMEKLGAVELNELFDESFLSNADVEFTIFSGNKEYKATLDNGTVVTWLFGSGKNEVGVTKKRLMTIADNDWGFIDLDVETDSEGNPMDFTFNQIADDNNNRDNTYLKRSFTSEGQELLQDQYRRTVQKVTDEGGRQMLEGDFTLENRRLANPDDFTQVAQEDFGNMHYKMEQLSDGGQGLRSLEVDMSYTTPEGEIVEYAEVSLVETEDYWVDERNTVRTVYELSIPGPGDEEGLMVMDIFYNHSTRKFYYGDEFGNEIQVVRDENGQILEVPSVYHLNSFTEQAMINMRNSAQSHSY